MKISSQIACLSKKIKINKNKADHALFVNSKLEEDIKRLEAIMAAYPDITFGNYPFRNEFILHSVTKTHRFISTATLHNSIICAEYGNIVVEGKSYRAYSSNTAEVLAKFTRKLSYYGDDSISRIEIHPSLYWNDPECKAKIKKIYRRFLKKFSKNNEEFIYSGIEHAPEYIKTLSNFKK